MKRKWFYGMASATIIALVVALNTVGPVNKSNTVSAMNQATNTIKANNAEQKPVTQSNVEVLANKGGTADTSLKVENAIDRPQVSVPFDLEVEKGDQKNADAGSSPWKLDPTFVAQVFVSLKVSPEGIQGDYPVKYEELKLVKNTEKEAVVEVSSKKSNIGKVYLKRLVKQDKTGIWTVVGYDSVNNN